MAILVVGLSTYDITVPMDGPLIENRKYSLSIETEGGGGPAYNAAYLCAKWGEETYLRSRIGFDPYGSALRSVLKEPGVREEELLAPEGFHTSYSYIYTNKENGNRTIMNFREKPEQNSYEFPDHDIKVIMGDGHEPRLTLDAFEQYPEAIRIADAGTAREDTMRIAREVDYLVASQVFAEAVLGEAIDLTDPEIYTRQFEGIEAVNRGTVIITMGDKGLLYRAYETEGPVIHMPAFQVKAIDTTGAGDIFHGAFMYGIANDMPYRDAIEMSAMAAAVSTETNGSQTSIPELDTVWERLEQIKLK